MDKQTNDPGAITYYDSLRAASKVVASLIHESNQTAISAGVDEAVKQLSEKFPSATYDIERVTNLLRREICRDLANLAESAADGWDELIV